MRDFKKYMKFNFNYFTPSIWKPMLVDLIICCIVFKIFPQNTPSQIDRIYSVAYILSIFLNQEL